MAIVWLWITTVVAIFYPLLDGGIAQTVQLFKGLGNRNSESGTDIVVYGNTGDLTATDEEETKS